MTRIRHKTTRTRRNRWPVWPISIASILAVIATVAWTMISMPGNSWSDTVPQLSAEERQIQENLQRHVEMLAQTIGERNVWNAGSLDTAAMYIRSILVNLGYEVRTRSFDSRGTSVQNIEVELPGASAPEEIIVVGAHYDSVQGGPGANDNASGIAALLEIARLLDGKAPTHTLRLVAFANEEQPFSGGPEMGSRVYAERSRQRGEQIKGMLSLETIGYYSDQPDSQHYPFPFSYIYPDTGNFIGFVSNLSSWRLVRQAVGAFRTSTAFPSEAVAAPEWIRGVGWSDHASFWQAGYPAIMITDTAFFRYPHYHDETDTPEKLDYKSLARVTRGLVDVVVELAGGEDAGVPHTSIK